MKNLVFILCIAVSGDLFGQAIATASWTGKGVKVDYALYRPNTAIQEVLIAFYDDADPAWRFETWAQELTWLADERGALLIAPSSDVKHMDSAKLEAWIRFVSDSLTLDRVKFVTLGRGVRHIDGLLGEECAGLIIAPSDTISTWLSGKDGVIGLIDSRKGDSAQAVMKALAKNGTWLFSKMVIGDHPYYFDQHKEVVLDVFAKMDSMLLILKDSSLNAGLRSTVLETGPEVLRQGKAFELSLFIAEEGVFSFQVLDLSGKAVQSKKVFLGKGRHGIKLPTKDLDWGVYKMEVDGPGILVKQKLMIRG
ncbi:MAG: hypothetical protein HQ500_05125 [Flavobacteriales bacterium]|nr:hypothetical protein [Flavobacteriales bacterium]